MNRILLGLVFQTTLFMGALSQACQNGNQAALLIRGSNVGVLTKDGNGRAEIAISPNFRPSLIRIAKRNHGREILVQNLNREWNYSQAFAKIQIRATDLKNDDHYFVVEVSNRNTYRRFGTLRIDSTEIFSIARSNGCGGVIQGF